MKEFSPFVWAIPAAMLIIALAPLPYGYYTLLRIVVCGAAAFLAWQTYTLEGQITGWVVLLGLIAALFNPIFPVHLTRDIWRIIDPFCAGLFGWHFFKVNRGA